MKTIPAHHSRHIASHSQRLNHPGILGNVSFPILLLASLLRTKLIHGHSAYKNSFLGGKAPNYQPLSCRTGFAIWLVSIVGTPCEFTWHRPQGHKGNLSIDCPEHIVCGAYEQPCSVYKERQLLHTRKWIFVGRFGFRSSSDMRPMQYSWSCECLQ